jgi:hypothetical protein
MVSPLDISVIALACILGGLFLGMFLRYELPERYFSKESEAIIGLGMALIATLTALVLALLVESAKNSYDTQYERINLTAASFLQLDRVMAEFGPEAGSARVTLRGFLETTIVDIWPSGDSSTNEQRFNFPASTTKVGNFAALIRHLQPHDDFLRELFKENIEIASDSGHTRALLLAHNGETIPGAFLVVLMFWLALLFASFGMFAPFNPAVVGFMVLSAVSVAGAIYLILQMDQAFEGLIQISNTPLRNVLNVMGK